MKIRISNIANSLLVSVAFLLFSFTLAFAEDFITFKYFLSDKFYYGENPLSKEEDPQFIRTKEAIVAGCKIWEKATNGNIVFILADSQEDADIIFEGWSNDGPKVTLEDETICINGYGDRHLFSDFFPESHGITLFEDCNTICKHPGILDAANAASNHRARIFFHLKNSLDAPAPWYYKTNEDKVSYVEAEKDVTRAAAHEIGHALGFCGHPDEKSVGCGEVPECKKNNASILCKNQARCYQEDEDGDILLGGMDDIDHLGIRDLTAFDKGRLIDKFFPHTKILYGKVKDADGEPIVDAVVTTGSEKITAKTDRNGIYSLWRVQPGTYTEKGNNPESGQSLGEIITITENAPNIIVKDFKFIRDHLNIQAHSRAIPSSGSFGDTYSFEATFSELEKNQQSAVSLFIDGSEAHQFRMPAADQNPVYAFSFFSLIGVKPGSHHYAFKASNKEGKWLQTLSGFFLVDRPSNIQLVTSADPKTVSVGKDSKTTITAWLKDDKGIPLVGEIVRFRTNFPGFFNPANGKAVTDSEGRAKIAFNPVSSGNAIIAAIPPYGTAASTTLFNTSPAVRLSFKIIPLGDNSYRATSYVKYLPARRPAAGEAVKWSLQSAGTVWTKQPDKKTDNKGRVSGIFSLKNPESTPVSIKITHIPTGVSGTGTFRLGGFEGYQVMPENNLGEPIERSEWSNSGYFAVRHRKGTGVSIYRVSDWKKVWGGKNLKGSYRSFFFSPDGRKMALNISGAKNKIAILNVAKGKVERSWDTTVESTEAIADKSFGWQGNDIYAIHDDNSIRQWSSSGKPKLTFSHNAEIQEFRFNPVNPSQFAAVDRYGELRIWDTGDPASVKTIKVESLPTGKLKCLAWSHDGTTLSVGSGIADSGIIYTFDTSNWSKSGFDLPGLGNVNSLDYNYDSSQLAIGHDEGMIVLNTDTYAIGYYSTSPSNHVRWSRDGSRLAAGGQIYVLDQPGFEAPRIEISTPQNGSSFTTKSIRINGKINGSQKISTASVKVNQEKPGALVLSSDGSFDQSVLITKEKNTIFIEAEDIFKNRSSVTITVEYIADSIPPTLTEPFVIADPPQKETTFNLSVRVYDGDSGVDTSRITATIRSPGGNSMARIPLYDDGDHGDLGSGDGIFGNSWRSSGTVEGLHSIDFYAFDKAGNSGNLANTGNFFIYDKPKIKPLRTTVTKPLSKDPITISADITDASGIQTAELIYSLDSGITWSREPMSGAGDTFKGTIPAQDMGTVFYKLKAIDVRGYSSETSAYAYRVYDETKPMVLIQKPATVKEAVTNKPFIVISGKAEGEGGLGLKRISCSTGDINTGTLENWSFNVQLNQGINTITIVAESQNGVLNSDTIDITYASELAAPVFSPAGPFAFADPIDIVITSPDEGVLIHYTTDNTEPTETSPLAQSPVLVSETTSIKAKSFKQGWTPSATATATYTLSKQKEDFGQEKEAIAKDNETLKKKTESDKSLTIQVAAFKEGKYADDLVEQLKKKGYPAYIVISKSQKNTSFYKVRIGSFKAKTEVENMLDRLKKDKIKAIIVVN